MSGAITIVCWKPSEPFLRSKRHILRTANQSLRWLLRRERIDADGFVRLGSNLRSGPALCDEIQMRIVLATDGRRLALIIAQSQEVTRGANRSDASQERLLFHFASGDHRDTTS